MASDRREGNLRAAKGALTKAMDTLFPQPERDACRVCHEPVVDGRWNYCSERCRRIAQAVQKMFIWDEVRERVLERDDYTCQACGLSKARQRSAHYHSVELARERVGGDRWGDEREEWEDLLIPISLDGIDRALQVDHITRLEDGGHPFDERNLQTLCERCHHEKTAAENSEESDDQRPEVALEAYLE